MARLIDDERVQALVSKETTKAVKEERKRALDLVKQTVNFYSYNKEVKRALKELTAELKAA